MKHTKGPWKIVDRYPDMVATYAADSIAIDCGGSGETQKECDANAKLVAAAPDLLEALKDLLSGGGTSHNRTVRGISQARAQEAIKKATE